MDAILKYVVIAMGVLLLTSCLGTYYFYNQYKAQIEIIATYKANTEELERNQAQKDEDIKLCNSRVEEFAKASKFLEDKGREAQVKAQAEAKKKDLIIQRLLGNTQLPGEDACVGAKRIIDGFLNERKANETVNPSF